MSLWQSGEVNKQACAECCPVYTCVCCCRTSFLFDNINLPAVVNENAVQTLLLNQDRYGLPQKPFACHKAIMRMHAAVEQAVSDTLYNYHCDTMQNDPRRAAADAAGAVAGATLLLQVHKELSGVLQPSGQGVDQVRKESRVCVAAFAEILLNCVWPLVRRDQPRIASLSTGQVSLATSLYNRSRVCHWQTAS